MTSPVTPPAAPTVPAYPALGSPAFNAEAYAYGTAMPGVVDGIAALAESAHTNALSGGESAAAAQQVLVGASLAASQALAAANFKGEWSTLAGALNKPACVKHGFRFWLLLNNLVNVAASVPSDGNPDWTTTDKVAGTALVAITYNGDGSIATVTEDGVTKTFAYNGDGTINTVRWPVGAKTRTETYSYTSGVLTGMTATEA